MKNMGAVDVNLDSFDFLGVDVAGNLRPFFQHQHLFPGVRQLPRQGRPVQAGPHDQIIVHAFPSASLLFRRLYPISLRKTTSGAVQGSGRQPAAAAAVTDTPGKFPDDSRSKLQKGFLPRRKTRSGKWTGTLFCDMIYTGSDTPFS